ncbi:Uncharacterised protein [Mycobacteroides abscessus subsp. abscessus]|nr:Uncharacterised protein [Mycobacteroides abscessus subsp. abscessus]
MRSPRKVAAPGTMLAPATPVSANSITCPIPATAPRPPRSLANSTSAGSGGRIWRTTHCYAPTPSSTLPPIWTWSSGTATRTICANATKPWQRIRCSAECGSAMTPPPSNGGRPW